MNHTHGFIITPQGRVSLWVFIGKRTADGFSFFVNNGAWEGRWVDTEDLLTNGVFKVANSRTRDAWQPATFRYAPPSMPYFPDTAYNAAIQWMENHLATAPFGA